MSDNWNLIDRDSLTDVAMQIILDAGNARNLGTEAVQLAKQALYAEALLKIQSAKKMLQEAHRSQTEVLQQAAGNGKVELSLLFIHALDTLMTIRSEVNMQREIIELYEHFNPVN